MDEKLILTEEWDKTFPESGKVKHRKVTFRNRFGITLAADMYEPAEYTGRLSAIAVSGPFGAVKEQASGLYAQTMAERGYTLMILMLTDVLLEGTHLLYLGDEDIITQAFGVQLKDHTCFLPGVVSRKKQVIPMLTALWG